MLQVFLHNSTTTPPQPGYGQLLRAAMSDVQAVSDGLEGHYRLVDGTTFFVTEDAGDDIAMIEAAKLTLAVSAAVFEIARRTGSFVVPEGGPAFRITGNPGEPPGMFAIAIQQTGLSEVATPSDLDDVLAEFEFEDEPESSRPSGPVSQDDRSLGRKLLDALLGRAA